MKKKRSIISLLMIIAIAFCNLFLGKGVQVKAEYYTYHRTNISQTVNGVKWTVYGTLAYDIEKKECFLMDIGSIQADIDENANIKEIVVPDSIFCDNIKADITTLSNSLFMDNTTIESVTLNSKITSIGENCFYRCKNLKTVKAMDKSQVIDVNNQAFYKCTSLEKIDFTVGNVGLSAFYDCEKLGSVTIGGSEERTIGNYAFYNTNLSEINFSETLTKIKLGAQCFANTGLRNVTVPGECELAQGVFKNCIKLQKAEFKGKVTRKELHQTYEEEAMYGVFENALGMEYDENGKLIEKEVIFHDTVVLQSYEKISSRIRGEFANCSGLTKVTFDSQAVIPKWTFYNCTNLENVNFNVQSGVIKLGSSCFLGCKLKDLHFYTELACIKDTTLSDSQASPFYNSNLVNLYFTPIEKKGYCVDISAKTLENVYFGENVDYIDGSIYESNNVKKIVIENPYLKPEERTASNFSYSGRNLLKDTLTQRHHIIGYSSSDATLQNVEAWMAKYSKNGIFGNIIQTSSMKVPELTYIGSVKKEDIDFSKLNVTYSKYDDVTKEIKAEQSTDGTDINGYIVETGNLPEILETNGEGESREYIYTVVLMGEKVFGKIIVEPKKVTSIKIDWKEDNIQNLVSNQPVTISDLVLDATVTYNDGEIETIPLSELSLENTKTVENTNTFIVSLKSDTSVKDTYTADISPNYITDMEVSYPQEEIYVGQSIDVNKIVIYPHYKYDDDPLLDRNIKPTKISDTVIMYEGENIIKVCYEDICTDLVICGLKVKATDMTAYFDSDNYKYIDGQEEIDKNSIKARVNYNDGTYKEIKGTELDSIEIVSRLSTELGVKVKYQNIESPVFYINVTPKQIEKIEVTAAIKSAIEGTTLPKNMVTQIDVTYNNGVTECLTKEKIDYSKLTFNVSEIKSDAENNIIVEYLGKTDVITIIGIPNTIKNISAVYTGSGVPVGEKVTIGDIKVTASNTNGVEAEVKSGCLLEDAVIYNVGKNTVIVHYGEYQCDVEVKGIAAQTPVPTFALESTEEPAVTSTKEPTVTSTEEPTVISTKEPKVVTDNAVSVTPITKPTKMPNAEATPAPEQLPADELPNGAVMVTKSAVTVQSSVKTVKITKKKTYKIVTNKKVVFTCEVKNATDLKYQFAKKGASVKENKWKTVKKNKISMTGTSNKFGILYISYKDENGKEKVIFTTGFKIDKKKATVNVKNNQTYKKGQKITFKDASGIKSAKLDGKTIKSGNKVTKKGNHTLVVVDKAGNKTKIKFAIK